MKLRMLMLAMSLSLTLALTACGGGGEDLAPPEGEQPPAEAPQGG